MAETDAIVDSSTTSGDNQADSPNANDVKSDSSSQEQVPFHEHPRFKELVEQKNEYKEKYENLETRFSEIEGKFKPAEPVKNSIPDPYDSPEEFAKFIKQETLSEIDSRQSANLESERKAEEMINSQFDEIRQTDKEIDEEAISEFAMEWGITNQDQKSPKFGQYDLIKAHQLMQKTNVQSDDKGRASIAPVGANSFTKPISNLANVDVTKLSTDQIMRLGMSGQLK